MGTPLAAARSPAVMTDRRSIEIDEDMPFQERTWRVQRVGWAVMALLVLAGLTGLFAGGPLSSAEATGAAIRVEYHRFERWHSSSELLVRLAPAAVENGRIALLLDGGYAERVEVERIEPPPDRALTTAEGPVFIYPVEQGKPPGTVVIAIKPARIGVLRGRIGVAGRPPAGFTQFVWP